MALALRLLAAAALASLTACSGPPSAEEVRAWRSEQPLTLVESDLAAVVTRVDARRATGDLDAARALASSLALAHPEAPEALWRAARAEADHVLVLRARGAPREERDLAGTSGLDYARRAAAAAGDDAAAELQAELAYALGTTTHLEPMFDRAERARETLDAAEAALAADPDQITAHATLATLHLRLATLPWIATLFAGDAPQGDLTAAELHARRCVALAPTLEHRLLLARVLAAREEQVPALALLIETLAAPDTGPRDAVLRPEARSLLEELGGG